MIFLKNKHSAWDCKTWGLFHVFFFVLMFSCMSFLTGFSQNHYEKKHCFCWCLRNVVPIWSCNKSEKADYSHGTEMLVSGPEWFQKSYTFRFLSEPSYVRLSHHLLVVWFFTSRDFSLSPGLGHSENEFCGLHPSGLLSTVKNHHTILHNWKVLLKGKAGLEYQRSLQVRTEG